MLFENEIEIKYIKFPRHWQVYRCISSTVELNSYGKYERLKQSSSVLLQTDDDMTIL